MPTEEEIAAGVKALRNRWNQSRIRLTPEPTLEEQARIVLEAAETVRDTEQTSIVEREEGR
jgi:hypothetical protein